MTFPTTIDILEDLTFFDDWEDRYQYIIDLGKDLPVMDPSLRVPERLVKGCQSNVWLEIESTPQGRLKFIVDSDAFIVKGLLMMVMAAYYDKSVAEIIDFDIDQYFQQLDLDRHLSPTRGNGLRAIVAKIKLVASISS